MQSIHLASKLALAGIAFIGSALLTPAQAGTNVTPTISGTPATTVTAGMTYSFQPTSYDANGDTLMFGALGTPSWATVDSKTGRLYGTPTAMQVGSYEGIQMAVWDGQAYSLLPKFSITVVAGSKGSAPTISGAAVTTATVNQAYSFKPNAFDMDGDALVFSVTDKPTWARLNKQTGELYGTPTQVGVYSRIEISVSDGTTRVKLPKFSITVSATAATPAPAPVNRSVELSWQPPTQNTDGSALTNLSGYRLVYGTAPGTYSNSIALNTVGISRYVVENLTAGKYYFALISRNSAGTESAPSNEAVVNVL